MTTNRISVSPRRLCLLLATILMLCGLGAPAAQAADCLMPTADHGQETIINNLLTQGGAGTIISLCPNTNFNLDAPVLFTAQNQELSTLGYPDDNTRAMLTVTGATQTAAIIGFCPQCSGLKLQNIQVNGNRPVLGYLHTDKALIEVGGSVSGQLIKNVHSFDPRSWSALHVFEGKLDCNDVTVIANDIGPSGEPNHEWADGISYACRNGHVVDNVVTDATDGGIVIFQAPGTLVENNTVIARTRTMLGGINLVDDVPYNGDYTGVVVNHNTIIGDGAMIKVGIAMGHNVWWPKEKPNSIRGATITNNLLRGSYFGYGLAVNGVSDFNISGNTVTAELKGVRKCATNPPSQAYIINPEQSTGSFKQQGFVSDNSFRYLICMDPAP